MMRQVKIFRWLASAAVCLIILAAGCAPTGEGAAKMPKAGAKKVAVALKFSPKDSTSYKLAIEAGRSIKWEGPLPDKPSFKTSANTTKLEMAFDEEIQSVDANGNALAKITIKELKYSSIVKDVPVVEFDSSEPKDPNYPLAKLIGQSYTIKIAPTGEVVEVVDTKEADLAVRKGSVPPTTALRLLDPEAIKERHGILVLPDAGKNQLRTGDNWSSTKTFSFGSMGSESYEKVYTLNKITDIDNQQVAVIEMNAIPASEALKGKTESELTKNFDNTKTYTGRLEFDSTTGKVEKYLEDLQLDWTIALPPAKQDPNQGPAILTMSATNHYRLEKID
ncbi:MAG: hypothetical protein PHY02_08695 [Phycisphaerae bacterium]|nr:hypothetical protein [Phycisphaerae bacterium]